jgi:probable HAF family extracellular repeat protein
MKGLTVDRIVLLILFTISMFSLSTADAQNSRQRVLGLKNPEPGFSKSHFERHGPRVRSGRQRSKPVRNSRAADNPLSVYTVTTIADTGNGSLREAITDANLNIGRDLIQFNIPGTGPHTIRPTEPLPEISDSVIIDGTTQPGYTGTPVIEIDGVDAFSSNGLEIAADGCTIKGIAITRFQGVGIGLIGDRNTIEGCFLGIAPDGVTDKGNGGDGIVVFSANNTIGNPNGVRNVISGNGNSGIRVSSVASMGNRIRNNYVGTDASGSSAVPNDITGIYLYQSSQDTIGGLGFSGMNVISGNLNAGIRIEGGLSQHIVVTTNRIGTSSNGSNALGNLHGIEIVHGTGTASGSPSNIHIGGRWTDAQNLISGNQQAGVAFFFDSTNGTGNVVAGNLIGTNAAGTAAIANTHGIYIERNDSAGSMPGVKIGGLTLSDSSNVLSGNLNVGILIRGKGARNNLVHGNYIGTTRGSSGPIAGLGNGAAGVLLDRAPGNSVGDANPMRGNVIGDNGWDGITMLGSSANGNSIYNNFIGTNSNIGGIDLGNHFDGIYIEGSNTTVGGINLKNEIAYNDSSGIAVISGTGNRLHGNAIYKNGSMGIDLAPLYISPNDTADLDGGANLGQNFPILDSASLAPDSIVIHGRFTSSPNSSYTLYFFKNDQRSPSRFGEGQFFIDSLQVTTDDSGWAFIEASFHEAVSDTQFITALAVDVEGNTSEFSPALCLRDSDGDGIFDCWESPGGGIDANADGIIDLDLSAMGAKPDHKDIFVEVDHMNAHRPANSVFSDVASAFAEVSNFLVHNPDGNDGINLHIQNDSTDTLTNALWSSNPWPDFLAAKRQHFGTAGERANPNVLRAKALIFRYCIFANSIGSTISGWARVIPGNAGNDFFVSLGAWGAGRRDDPRVQAGTFMHELGHTLGLQHGGGDSMHFKPNYYSVMNYAWQCPQAVTAQDTLSWELVFSPTQLPTLNENRLLESQGLGLTSGVYPVVRIPYAHPNGAYAQALLKVNTGVDWDGNGDSSGFALSPVDVNNIDTLYRPSPGDTLYGYADWPNLRYNFRIAPGVLSRSTLAGLVPDEMTEETYNHLLTLPPYGIVRIRPSLRWLGTFVGGTRSEALGVSDDGVVVTGNAMDQLVTPFAFRWTAATGLINLGTLGGGASVAGGISGDGTTIVGYAEDSSFSEKAFRWTAATGMQNLNAGNASRAAGVSSDGTVIIINRYPDAYRWTSSGGLQNIGTLGGNSSAATAISSDGSVIAGFSYTASNDPYAFRWVLGGGMTAIGPYYSFAQGMSGNGNVITGSETGAAGLHRAFRWTAPDNFEFNIVGNFSFGSDVSYDGKYLVGSGSGGAFRLSRTNTLEIFNQVFASLLTPGSDLFSVAAISANGRYVVGKGRNGATNRDEAYWLDTGGILTTSVDDNKEVVVNDFSLEQNFPNPFNPRTTIRYYVPVSSPVSITIYNILGQQVATLVDEFKAAGKYDVEFNASQLSSGVYFYRLEAAGHVQTRKLLLLK